MKILMFQALAHPAVHTPTYQAADEDRSGRGNLQVNPYRERQRGHTTKLEYDRDHHAKQHECPGQLAIENSFDDITHQGRFWRRKLAHLCPIRPGVMHSVESRVHQPDSGS